MRSTPLVPIATLLLVAVAGTLPGPVPAQTRTVVVDLELAQEFYYEGDPLNLKISVRNVGSSKEANPIKTPLFQGFKVRPK